MIALYCAGVHGGDGLCGECKRLTAYARDRLERCPFGEEKPICKECSTHCYGTEEREQIRAVMRYSGPRMLLHNPNIALAHLLHSSRTMRRIMVVLGWFFVALAVVGIPLPGLPTTPFLLLSAGLFAKSSPRFHRWLLAHKTFGPIIESWQRNRSIPRAAKRKALLLIALSGGLSLWLMPVIHAKILLAIILASVALYLWRLPES